MSQLHVMFQKSLMKNGKASKLFGKMCGNVSNLCVVLKTFIEKTETKFLEKSKQTNSLETCKEKEKSTTN